MARAIQRNPQKTATVSLLEIILYLPGCSSLKEKRGRLGAIITRLRRDFNLSVAETDYQDALQSACLSCALVSNDAVFNSRVLNDVTQCIENHFPGETIIEYHVETF